MNVFLTDPTDPSLGEIEVMVRPTLAANIYMLVFSVSVSPSSYLCSLSLSHAVCLVLLGTIGGREECAPERNRSRSSGDDAILWYEVFPFVFSPS